MLSSCSLSLFSSKCTDFVPVLPASVCLNQFGLSVCPLWQPMPGVMYVGDGTYQMEIALLNGVICPPPPLSPTLLPITGSAGQ